MSSICFQISSKGVRNNEFNRKKKEKRKKEEERGQEHLTGSPEVAFLLIETTSSKNFAWFPIRFFQQL